jgi:hypothetical protein
VIWVISSFSPLLSFSPKSSGNLVKVAPSFSWDIKNEKGELGAWQLPIEVNVQLASGIAIVPCSQSWVTDLTPQPQRQRKMRPFSSSWVLRPVTTFSKKLEDTFGRHLFLALIIRSGEA